MSMDTALSCSPVQPAEFDAANNIITTSPHTHLNFMPNHSLSRDGQLHGFHFQTSIDDRLNVLPFSDKIFKCSCLYEIKYNENDHGRFNDIVLSTLNDMDIAQSKLIEGLNIIGSQSEDIPEARLDCMPHPEESSGGILLQVIKDSKSFSLSPPDHAGIYHAFVHNRVTCAREHRIFLIIQGSLRYAAEELLNLFHDSKDHITIRDFMACEELHWLRKATQRNHNRIARILLSTMGLEADSIRDYDDPGDQPFMCLPATVTFSDDIRVDLKTQQVHLVDGGCFTDLTSNGVLFDTLQVDGFWLFCGAPDQTDGKRYGTELTATHNNVFPAFPQQFHEGFKATANTPIRKNKNKEQVAMVDEAFMQTVNKMGFNRNHNVIYLMELLSVSREA